MTLHPLTSHPIEVVKKLKTKKLEDQLITEEPLQIDIVYYDKINKLRKLNLAVTMRTPGNEVQLTKGFLLSEDIISAWEDIEKIEEKENQVIVYLQLHVQLDESMFSRNVFSNSSCGICGKASIESINSDSDFLPWSEKWTINRSIIQKALKAMEKQDLLFHKTGGNHFAALFNRKGELLDVFEDVGRHNAMDKLIGNAESLPLNENMVLWSGRSSFELVQKAAKAGLPITLSIGAPSSLSVQLAEEHGMTLIGFLKKKRFNVYCHGFRVENE